MEDCDIVDDCCRINPKLDSGFVDLTISFTLYGRKSGWMEEKKLSSPSITVVSRLRQWTLIMPVNNKAIIKIRQCFFFNMKTCCEL